MIDVRAHLARKPLLFDGGMGTYYKAKPGTECEQGNLLDPAGVRKVHREYLEAGAEAIKTNTFGLPRMAAARQPDWQALARAGWKLAAEAAVETGAAVFATWARLRIPRLPRREASTRQWPAVLWSRGQRTSCLRP